MVCAPVVPAALGAQTDIVGRVISSSTREPIVGAEAFIPKLGVRTVTDSGGRFRLQVTNEGDFMLVVRALGYQTDSAMLEIFRNAVVARDFLLRIITSLPGQRITASAEPTLGKLAAFYERQRAGIGYFMGPELLAKHEGRMLTGDLLSRVPNLAVKRGGSKAWIATARAPNASGGCAFCRARSLAEELDRADIAAGARPACYMDVYLDGILVYQDSQRPRPPLFNVNSLDLRTIAAIEVYSSGSRIPSQYNRTSAGCGALLIWTRN